MLRTRIGLAGISFLTLAAASGCAFFEPEEEDLDFEAYEDQLTEMYNESVSLIEELDAAEARIVQTCLEEQGFEVHPPEEFTSWPPEPRETFMDQSPYSVFLPTAEEAGHRGYWQWTDVPGAEEYQDGALYAEFLEYQQAMYGPMGLEEEFAEGTPEFYLLDADDQYAWYIAYAGEAWAAGMHGELAGVEPATNDEGEAIATSPPPEGCKGQMIEAVYGGFGDGADEDEYWDMSMVRPSQPDGDWTAMSDRYTERTAEFEGDLLVCLDGRGREGWEFYEGDVLVHMYLQESGEGEYALHSREGSGTRWPDPPEDAPDADDLEGWLEFERALAVDFAECGDESGFRAAAEDAWQQAQLHYYLGIEGATFAWQEQMREYLDKAQGALGA